MYNFYQFMSERNTTVCHTAFPILCAQCCIGVLMGFQIKSCSAQCWPSCKEPVVHPHISPMKKSHVKLFSPPPLFFSHYFFFFCSGNLCSHVAIKAKILRDALPASEWWSQLGSCQSSCCFPCLACPCHCQTQELTLETRRLWLHPGCLSLSL